MLPKIIFTALGRTGRAGNAGVNHFLWWVQMIKFVAWSRWKGTSTIVFVARQWFARYDRDIDKQNKKPKGASKGNNKQQARKQSTGD